MTGLTEQRVRQIVQSELAIAANAAADAAAVQAIHSASVGVTPQFARLFSELLAPRQTALQRLRAWIGGRRGGLRR